MWSLLVQAFVWIASTYLIGALTPKPKLPKRPKFVTAPFEAPTADPTLSVQLAFGTCKIVPNVLWYGGVTTRPVINSDGDQIANNYVASIDFGICLGPVDSVRSMYVDDKDVQWLQGTVTAGVSAEYTFNQPYLLGGPLAGGGVGTHVFFLGPSPASTVYLGSSSQPIDPQAQYYVPNYPGMPFLAHACITAFWGHNPQLPSVAFVVERLPNGLGLSSSHHKIASTVGSVTTYDANPACMIYEILTNAVWGLGIDPALIDVSGFQAVGNALYTEGFGLSMTFDQATPAADVIREILRHIDGGLTNDALTGKLVLKLIRADYTVGALPVLDESCIDEVELSRSSWSEVTNTVRVTFRSWADNWSDRICQWQNLAAQQVQGVMTVATFEFPGCSNAATANLVTARALKTVSYPFAKLRFKANRKAWALRQCDAFVLDWAPLGITGMVCRVTKPAGGQLEDGRMTIECIEDAFAIANTAYAGVPNNDYVDTAVAPRPFVLQRLLELPYQLIWYEYFLSSHPSTPDVVMIAARPSLEVFEYYPWRILPGDDKYSILTLGTVFAPLGRLRAAYPKGTAYQDSTGFIVDMLADASEVNSSMAFYTSNVAFKGLMLIDDEILGFTGVTGADSVKVITGIWRGLFDTVPVNHDAGSEVWFISEGTPRALIDASEDTADNLTLQTFKLQPLNPVTGDPADLSGCTPFALQLANKFARPNPPGDMKVGGSSWPTTFAHGTDRAVTWARRNRYNDLTTSYHVTPQDGADVPHVSGALFDDLYEVQVRVNGKLVRTIAAGDVVTWTWTSAMQATDCASAYNKTVSIRLVAIDRVDATLRSQQYQERIFQIT